VKKNDEKRVKKCENKQKMGVSTRKRAVSPENG